MVQQDDIKQLFKLFQTHGALIPVGDSILGRKDILVNRYIYRFGKKLLGKSFPTFFVVKVIVTVEVYPPFISVRYGTDKLIGCAGYDYLTAIRIAFQDIFHPTAARKDMLKERRLHIRVMVEHHQGKWLTDSVRPELRHIMVVARINEMDAAYGTTGNDSR